jgi:tetratricopeptide (TPR) repeat protein
LPRHPKYNALSRSRTAENTNAAASYPGASAESGGNRRRDNSASYGRTRLTDLYVRWELWDDLITLGKTSYLEPTDIPEEQAKRAKALGIAYFSKGDIENGMAEIAALETALKTEKDFRREDMEEAEAKARKDKKSDEDVKKAMTEALDAHMSKVKSIEKSLQELRLYELLARDKKDEVEKQIEEVKDLPKERLARIHLKLGDKEKAIKLAKEAVEGSTNQVQTLANYVAILNECEKEDEAKEQFERLRAVASQADLGLPVFERLEPLAKSVGLKDDWRLPYKPASDVVIVPRSIRWARFAGNLRPRRILSCAIPRTTRSRSRTIAANRCW